MTGSAEHARISLRMNLQYIRSRHDAFLRNDLFPVSRWKDYRIAPKHSEERHSTYSHVYLREIAIYLGIAAVMLLVFVLFGLV